MFCSLCRYRWDLKQLLGSGGMPSSHSSTVTALAVAIGLQEGFGGSHFAIALILASVVSWSPRGILSLAYSLSLSLLFIYTVCGRLCMMLPV